MGINHYHTLKVRFEQDICFVQMYRPDADNALNEQMIDELIDIYQVCETQAKIVVLEGTESVFCFGADFKEVGSDDDAQEDSPAPLYELWQKMATGPYLTIAHVRGKVNAGGVGLVAASDIVLSESAATFSLSELLFGLMPACVLPFLIRRIGVTKANYMTLMTQPIQASQAAEWGLVDTMEQNSTNLLRRHLLRLRRLDKKAISRYKAYLAELDSFIDDAKAPAVAANLAVFSDPENVAKIVRYTQTGQFPWEDNRA